MKKKNHYNNSLTTIRTGWYFMLLLILAVGCLDDRYDSTDKPEIPDDQIEISFTTYVSGNQDPSTRALFVDDEYYPSQIDLFVFKVNPQNGEETYFYHIHGSDIHEISDQSGKKLYGFNAQVRLSESGEKHRLVIFANLRKEISTLAQTLPEDTPKEEVLKKAVFESTEKWTAERQDYMPMWGGSVPVEVTKDISTIDGTIRMLRSVAKLDIGLKLNESNGEMAAAGLDNFKIRQVVVRNAIDYGRAAPLEGNITGDVATAPSLPTQNGRSRVAFNPDTQGNGVLGKIYLAESSNTTSATLDEKVCVLVEGYYSEDPDNPNTATTSWYRIDFYDGEE